MNNARQLQEVFLSVLRTPADKRAIAKKTLLFTSLDWEQLVLLSKETGLFPVFYSNLVDLSLPSIPAKLLNDSKAVFFLNLKVNSRLEKNLLAVISYLKDNEVAAIPLKGPAVAGIIHKDLALRQASCDLDLLVKPEDRERSVALLKDFGFLYPYAAPNEDFFYRYRSAIMLRKDYGTDFELNLDLHWGFRDKFISNNINRFWSHAVKTFYQHMLLRLFINRRPFFSRSPRICWYSWC
jgi:hypothetical protein